MRDRGFDFRWYDPYSKNIFARGFEWNESQGNISSRAVTAFEVLEHVSSPVTFISNAMARAQSSAIIFSTLLYEGEPPLPEKWWYYSLASGQHISFFRRQTLHVLAQTGPPPAFKWLVSRHDNKENKRCHVSLLYR